MSVRFRCAPGARSTHWAALWAALWAGGRAGILLFAACVQPHPASAADTSAPPVALQFCRGRCGPPYTLRVADTPRAQARGLMGVRSLPPRGGMLFVFSRPARRAFWMKDTPLALDLIFIGANCRVAGIVADAVPHAETELRVAGESQYVVELAAGSAAAAGVRAGDRVAFVSGDVRCPNDNATAKGAAP